MQDFIRESKRIIKRARTNGNLVIFVGAGVSLNSGYPSWGKLVQKFADGLGIKSYGADEYLKIPQYYYDIRNEKEYYDVITDTFNIKPSPVANSIDNLIVKNFNPDRIITTNYDELLEMAATKLGVNYDVVAKDRDLPYNPHYKMIIKMHGDLKNKNIVLKEEDFLSYSENFRLIETYIKGLIATDLVLFVGYSVSDPDVKEIFTWVKDILGEDFQEAYFLDPDIDSEGLFKNKNREIEFDYFKHMGINMIYYTEALKLGDKEFPKNLTPSDLTNKAGIALYRLLYYLVMDDSTNLKVTENIEQLNQNNNNERNVEIKVQSDKKLISNKNSITEGSTEEKDKKIKDELINEIMSKLPVEPYENITDELNLGDSITKSKNNEVGNFIGISYTKYTPTNDPKKPWNKVEGVHNGQIIANDSIAIKIKYCNGYKQNNPVYDKSEFYNLSQYNAVMDKDKKKEHVHYFYFDDRIRRGNNNIFWVCLKIYDKNYASGHNVVNNGLFDYILTNDKNQKYITNLQTAIKFFKRQPDRVLGIGYYHYEQTNLGSAQYVIKYMDKFIRFNANKIELLDFGVV